tara:strand:+ start:210 stop:686 length:477 start_codon:yes stop_codon:yes gene_type:complete
MRWNDYIIDSTDFMKAFKSGCSVCGQNPCVCGSKEVKEAPCKECEAEDPHENLEQLAKKIVPLVDEMNEELERHAAICKKRTWGDKDAGYPPNCKKGFVEKGGKCVPEEKDNAEIDKKNSPNSPSDKGFKGPQNYFKGGHKKNTYSDLWEKVNQKDNT